MFSNLLILSVIPKFSPGGSFFFGDLVISKIISRARPFCFASTNIFQRYSTNQRLLYLFVICCLPIFVPFKAFLFYR
ncbi:unnamed protein product [Tenebrio molitor]|nr:unnamed protein product [Tenebrio molitor]